MPPTQSFVCVDVSLTGVHPGFGVGSIVSGPQQAKVASSRGAVLLPITPELVRAFPLGGYCRREWGLEGWVFDKNAGESGCPTALMSRSGNSVVHWAACVEPFDHAEPGQGRLQLTVARSAPVGFAGGLRASASPAPFDVPARARHVISGTSTLALPADGFVLMQLHGVCSNVRVLWLAVSQVAEAQ